jgi:uncharacterized protein YecE (DUF72 family)
MKKSKLFIGTSGWNYGGWEEGVFYPKGLSKADQLFFYAENFKTVELNASFYHLMPAKTFQNWHQKTPEDFIFAVKASRFITHVKKLKDASKPWKNFINNAKYLKEKLGPILFQLPPKWKCDSARLKNFLKILPSRYQYCFEFREKSWFCEEIYQILTKKNAALCLSDSPSFPFEEKITAPFIYIRLHGPGSLYASNYSKKQLKNWAEKIKKYLTDRFDVYTYFNNDAFGYAPKNAEELISLINR